MVFVCQKIHQHESAKTTLARSVFQTEKEEERTRCFPFSRRTPSDELILPHCSTQ
jgi:hypothetical protein